MSCRGNAPGGILAGFSFVKGHLLKPSFICSMPLCQSLSSYAAIIIIANFLSIKNATNRRPESSLHGQSYCRTALSHWISAPTLAAASSEQEEISGPLLLRGIRICTRILDCCYHYRPGFRIEKRVGDCPRLVDITLITEVDTKSPERQDFCAKTSGNNPPERLSRQ